MPYSTACNTPLSNFEAGLDYRDVSDPAVTVRLFPGTDDYVDIFERYLFQLSTAI